MKTVPASDFRARLTALGFNVLDTLDRQVNCPSPERLARDFSAYLSDVEEMGPGEAGDCDNWTLFTRVMADRANADAGSRDGIACAIVKLTIFPGMMLAGIPGPGAHLTNLFLLDDDTLCLYEPQTQILTYCPDDRLPVGCAPVWALC